MSVTSSMASSFLLDCPFASWPPPNITYTSDSSNGKSRHYNAASAHFATSWLKTAGDCMLCMCSQRFYRIQNNSTTTLPLVLKKMTEGTAQRQSRWSPFESLWSGLKQHGNFLRRQKVFFSLISSRIEGKELCVCVCVSCPHWLQNYCNTIFFGDFGWFSCSTKPY